MNLNLFPFFILFCVLAAIVIAMIIWRRIVSQHEDNFVHVMGDIPADQVRIEHKLEQIDKWGKLITVITVVYGVAIGALYFWQTWVQNSSSTGQ